MKEKENNHPKPPKVEKEKPELSPAQLQQRKKMIIFPLLFLLFAGCMYLIFAPSGDKEQEHTVGFNTDLPTPKEGDIVSDKRDAYMQEAMDAKQKDKMRSLQDFAFTLGENSQDDRNDEKVQLAALPADNPLTMNQGQSSSRTHAFQSSGYHYQDINRQLDNFYEQPATQADEKAQLALEWRIQELERKSEEDEIKKNAADEQLAIIEKSYQLAAKYMPQGQPTENENLSKRIVKGADNGKTKISPIRQIQNQMVSSLAQHISDEELFDYYDQPHHIGFNTMDGEVAVSAKNTISAVIHEDQIVIDGQATRIRLTEPLVAGTTLIPENTILTGMAKIQGERLDILISSIEYQGTIIAVEMTVYDSDAQRGIHIPGSLELNASKEVVANMGNSVGTSFTMTQSTGAQLASDLSKGAIQGVSAYMQKKIRQVRVTLKSGYRIMLMPKQ